MAEFRNIAGRNCSPAPIAISLHKFVGSLSQLEGYIGNCLNKQRPSYNYGIEDCRVKEFVPVADTAYAIPYPVCPIPTPPDCPVILAECSDGTSVLDGFTGNPNCKVISIAVVGGLNNADICDTVFDCNDARTQCLARSLKNIADANGIVLDATNLLLYGFDEFPICELLECIANVQPEVIPPNPESVLLCQALSQFPTGSPVTVFGKDASGNCVQGTIPTGAVTTNALALAGTQLTSTVNGVPAVADLAGLIPVIPPTTNVLALAGNQLTSTVDGIASAVDLSSIIPAPVVFNKCDTVVCDPPLVETFNFVAGDLEKLTVISHVGTVYTVIQSLASIPLADAYEAFLNATIGVNKRLEQVYGGATFFHYYSGQIISVTRVSPTEVQYVVDFTVPKMDLPTPCAEPYTNAEYADTSATLDALYGSYPIGVPQASASLSLDHTVTTYSATATPNVFNPTVDKIASCEDLATAIENSQITVEAKVNTTVPQFELIVNGQIVQTLPLTELTEAITGNHLGYIFP